MINDRLLDYPDGWLTASITSLLTTQNYVSR
jgi:hypothetical protein